MADLSRMKVMVEVECICGNAINIRGRGTRKSVLCWKCNREVGYEMRGWMRADGYVVDDFVKHNRVASVISQEEE